MASNINALVRRIEEVVVWAERAERDCSDLLNVTRGVDDEPDENLLDAERRLEDYTRQMYRELRLMAEALGLKDTVAEILQEEKRHPNLSCMEHDPEMLALWSPALRRALGYFASLKSLVSDSHDALGVFHSILDQSGQIIKDLKLIPKNETEVRNAILRTVRYAFPDASKEYPSPNNITNFRMDIAVPSLGAVAEYKFVDSEKSVQLCLDGIYADMTAYGGNDEWKHFFAVIYMTEQYKTSREVELEFRRVGARANWTPVVVIGQGERSRKRAGRKDVQPAP